MIKWTPEELAEMRAFDEKLEQQQKVNEKRRAYRKANPEKFDAARKRYRERHPDAQKKYWARHKDQINEIRRAKYKAAKEGKT